MDDVSIMSAFPKPDALYFDQSDILSPLPSMQSQKGLNTKPSSSSSHNELTLNEKRALETFLSLVSDLDSAADRLYSFNEHLFSIEVTNLTITILEKGMRKFRCLVDQIHSQQVVDEQLQTDQIPSPVSFSICPVKESGNDQWPNPESYEWLRVAEHKLNFTPPIIMTPVKSPDLFEIRLRTVEENRRRIANANRRRTRALTNRVRIANERMRKAEHDARASISEKMNAATMRREAELQSRIEKAKREIDKVSESNDVYTRESDARRVIIAQKQQSAIERHQNHLAYLCAKAHERSLCRSSQSYWAAKKRLKCCSILEGALQASRLPDDIYGPEEPDAIPEFPHVVSQPQPESILALESTMRRMEPNASMAIKYLQVAADAHYAISPQSPSAQFILGAIRKDITNCELILSQLIHNIESSFPFCFAVGIELACRFKAFCHEPGSLKSSLMLLYFWNATCVLDKDNAKILMSQLAAAHVFERLCNVLESVSVEDFGNGDVESLLHSVIDFISSVSPFLPAATVSNVICPSLATFLGVLPLTEDTAPIELGIKTVRVVQTEVIRVPETMTAFVERRHVVILLHAIRTFLGTQSELFHNIELEWILLLGLMCHRSALFQEACLWLPQPTILESLCNLPLSWYMQEPEASFIIPTIVACCTDNPENTRFVRQHVNGALIAEFLQNSGSTQKDGLASG